MSCFEMFKIATVIAEPCSMATTTFKYNSLHLRIFLIQGVLNTVNAVYFACTKFGGNFILLTTLRTYVFTYTCIIYRSNFIDLNLWFIKEDLRNASNFPANL